MIYPFKCNGCGSEYEVERSIHEDAPSPTCVTCHEPMVRKWIAPAIQFRGSGFYSTDKG